MRVLCTNWQQQQQQHVPASPPSPRKFGGSSARASPTAPPPLPSPGPRPKAASPRLREGNTGESLGQVSCQPHSGGAPSPQTSKLSHGVDPLAQSLAAAPGPAAPTGALLLRRRGGSDGGPLSGLLREGAPLPAPMRASPAAERRRAAASAALSQARVAGRRRQKSASSSSPTSSAASAMRSATRCLLSAAAYAASSAGLSTAGWPRAVAMACSTATRDSLPAVAWLYS